MCLGQEPRRHSTRSPATSIFLVEFEDPTSPSYFDHFFSLKEGLEQILGRPTDLVTRACIQNPYLLRRMEETGESLYAA